MAGARSQMRRHADRTVIFVDTQRGPWIETAI